MGFVCYESVYILLCFVLSCSALNALYVISDVRKSADNYKLKTLNVNTKGECVFACERETALSLEYTETSGLFVCHSALPWALDLATAADTDVYFNPERLDYVPVVCQSTGYIYHSNSHFCYKIHTETLRWIDAQAVCQSEGGLLAKVDTSPKRELINLIVSEDGSIDYYLGAKDTAQDGVWRWLADNSLLSGFSKLGSRQCLEIGHDDLAFDDTNCNNNKAKFICEIILA